MQVLKNENIILIGEAQIPYRLQKGKRDQIRIAFNTDHTLEIRTGSGELDSGTEAFLREKSRWISKHYSHKHKQHYDKQDYLDSLFSEISLLGIPHKVIFEVDAKTRYHYNEGTHFKICAPEKLIEERKKELLYFSIKAFADRKLKSILLHWAEHCKLDVNTIRVKNLKSKWGSCSSQRNINLNYHLVLLEETLVDYIIIHELMHLHEMNHSSRFWDWVDKYYPDYKMARTKLKEKQWLIGILN